MMDYASPGLRPANSVPSPTPTGPGAPTIVAPQVVSSSSLDPTSYHGAPESKQPSLVPARNLNTKLWQMPQLNWYGFTPFFVKWSSLLLLMFLYYGVTTWALHIYRQIHGSMAARSTLRLTSILSVKGWRTKPYRFGSYQPKIS
jgi:hypothetical protein